MRKRENNKYKKDKCLFVEVRDIKSKRAHKRSFMDHGKWSLFHWDFNRIVRFNFNRS